MQPCVRHEQRNGAHESSRRALDPRVAYPGEQRRSGTLPTAPVQAANYGTGAIRSPPASAKSRNPVACPGMGPKTSALIDESVRSVRWVLLLFRTSLRFWDWPLP